MSMKKITKRVLLGVTLISAVAGVGVACYAYRMQKSAEQKSSVQKKLDQKIKIACIGDSITYGSGVLPTRGKDSYPAKLGHLLGDGYKIFNYGLRGRTLLNEGDQPYREEKFFAQSQKVEPDIVLIMLGTNDSKPYNWNAEAYQRELEDFVVLYKELPNQPKVYLMTCCAAFCAKGKDEVAYNVDKSVIEDEILDIIKRVGKQCQIPVIDIYEATKEHPEYFIDGVHPNAEGNQVIAQTVYSSLKKEMSEVM